MNKIFITLLIALISVSSLAQEKPIYAKKYIPNMEQAGYAKLTFLFWDIYDAYIYAPKGIYKEDKPFALRLQYLMNFKGKDIAKRSIEEIKKQGFKDNQKLAGWQLQLEKIFPDVVKGTILTGVYTKDKKAIFYKDGVKLAELKDKELSKLFFDIWLSEKTSEPKFRRKLLNEK